MIKVTYQRLTGGDSNQQGGDAEALTAEEGTDEAQLNQVIQGLLADSCKLCLHAMVTGIIF